MMMIEDYDDWFRLDYLRRIKKIAIDSDDLARIAYTFSEYNYRLAASIILLDWLSEPLSIAGMLDVLNQMGNDAMRLDFLKEVVRKDAIEACTIREVKAIVESVDLDTFRLSALKLFILNVEVPIEGREVLLEMVEGSYLREAFVRVLGLGVAGRDKPSASLWLRNHQVLIPQK